MLLPGTSPNTTQAHASAQGSAAAIDPERELRDLLSKYPTSAPLRVPPDYTFDATLAQAPGDAFTLLGGRSGPHISRSISPGATAPCTSSITTSSSSDKGFSSLLHPSASTSGLSVSHTGSAGPSAGAAAAAASASPEVGELAAPSISTGIGVSGGKSHSRKLHGVAIRSFLRKKANASAGPPSSSSALSSPLSTSVPPPQTSSSSQAQSQHSGAGEGSLGASQSQSQQQVVAPPLASLTSMGGGSGGACGSPRRQFGVPLETLMEEQKGTRPGLLVPYVVVFLVEGLLAMGAEKTQGIFRLSPKYADEAEARARIDGGEMVLPQEISICSSMLKTWMRMLPEALVPEALYERATAAETPGEVVETVLRKLPPHSFATVAYLGHFIAHLALDEYVAHTQMTPENFAGVFAPCFLHCPYEDLEKRFACTAKEKNFVLLLLEAVPSLPDCGFRASLSASIYGPSPRDIRPPSPAATAATIGVPAGSPLTSSGSAPAVASPLSPLSSLSVSSSTAARNHHPPTPAPGFLPPPPVPVGQAPLDIPPPTTPPMPHMPPPPIPLGQAPLDIPPPTEAPPPAHGHHGKAQGKPPKQGHQQGHQGHEGAKARSKSAGVAAAGAGATSGMEDKTPPQPILPPPPAPDAVMVEVEMEVAETTKKEDKDKEEEADVMVVVEEEEEDAIKEGENEAEGGGGGGGGEPKVAEQDVASESSAPPPPQPKLPAPALPLSPPPPPTTE